mmetsp:Transcript_29968/g.95682  ORF Transcript_29968/g.95682 Transcript_29968/m.95682 type:complete len:333 (+) Transcript_29968:1118-2116(+)
MSRKRPNRRLVAELQWAADTPVDTLQDKQIVALYQLLRDATFGNPSASCLSPVGEYNMRLGVIKELRPDLVATHQESACVVEGHPAVIEAGVCLGGRDAKPGITVYRFANRIPLLFEGGGDVATVVSKKRIAWANYKIRHTQDKIGVFVSLVSTKVPFKGTGKEYIGDDIPEVREAVKRAIEKCCLQLKAKIVKQRALADEREKKKNLTKYIPDVSRALIGMMSQLAEAGGEAGGGRQRARPRDAEHDALLEQVRSKRLKEEDLSEKLRVHVETCDAANALETVEAGKRGARLLLQDLYLSPLDEATELLPEVQHPLFALKLHARALHAERA